jgi:hypothetical protein
LAEAGRALTDEYLAQEQEDDLVDRVAEVFAGGVRDGAPAWRHVGPRVGSVLARARPDRYRRLVRVLAAAVALWIVIGVAAALSGERNVAHRPPVAHLADPHAAVVPATRPPSARPRGRRAPRSVRRPALPRAKPFRQAEQVRVVTKVLPLRETAVSAAPPAPTANAPAPEPAPEQSGGGPFSP